MHVGYPYHIDGRGRTADAAFEPYVRQLIEQVLFTAPGERVNRPDFGTGLRRLVFAPNSTELASATEFMIQGALQQFLGDLIQVEEVQVRSEDAALHVRVGYVIRKTSERRQSDFTREV